MKIQQHEIEQSTIEAFADKHSLVMEVHERSGSKIGAMGRFYAHFQNCELADPPFLVGVFGDGRTAEEAISNYADKISMSTLVIDAMRDTRRDIKTPRFIKPGAKP